MPKPHTTPCSILSSFLVLFAVTAACRGRPPATVPKADPEAAFLFAYRAKPGKREVFDEGYRRHLAWHGGKRDPFAWYGWDVVAGSEAGAFVDGTFGPTQADFARRIDPSGDSADFQLHIAPFAVPSWQRVYRRRPELGASRFLEERAPSAFVRVLRYDVRPGASGELEAVLRRLAAPKSSADDAPTWAAYELVNGGGAAYVLLVPEARLFEPQAPTAWLEAQAAPSIRAEVASSLARSVAVETSAIWQLRPDLTLIPPGERPAGGR